MLSMLIELNLLRPMQGKCRGTTVSPPTYLLLRVLRSARPASSQSWRGLEALLNQTSLPLSRACTLPMSYSSATFTIKLKRTYALISVPITFGVLFSTIYLGQHYITHLVAGVLVAAACVLVVTRLDRSEDPPLTLPTGKL